MSQKLTHAYLVYRFLRKVIFPGHWFLLCVASLLGAAGRVLALTGFAATLKTFMVAISPDKTLEVVNHIVARWDVVFTQVTLLWSLVGFVFAIYALNFVVQLGSLYVLGKLTKRILTQSIYDREPIDYDYDVFMVQNVQRGIVGVVRMAEIMLFSALCLTIIATLYPLLILLLLPLLAIFSIFLVFNGRHRLVIRENQRTARKEYFGGLKKIRRGEGGDQEWLAQSRPAYISARYNVFRYGQFKTHVGVFLAGVTALFVIIYLATMTVDKSQLWGPAILLVLAIRQLVAYTREFANQATIVLELRTDVALMKNRDADL